MKRAAHFPQWVLWSVGVLLSIVLVLVFSRNDSQSLEPSTAQTQLKRELYFADRQDGAVEVRVRDSQGNWLSRSTLEPGADGFVRSMIRGLMRERKAHDMALTPPFELIQHGDGALVLHDPLTRRQILLQAFGPTNAGSFARYLAAPTQAAQL